MRHALMYLFFAGVLIIGTIIFVYHARKYYMFRKYFQNNTNVIADEREQEIIQAYISKNNIDKSIRVYEYSDERVTPITMGVIEPIIILLKMDWTKQDLEFVMEHEVTHIRQRDNLIKFLAIVVAVLNFYNPLAFYLLNKWEEVAEMTCDSKVLAGKSQEEVSRYGNLIIDLATMKAKNKIFPILGLSLNFQKKAMEERIHTMKKEVKKEGLLKKALGIGTLGVALFISSLPVMAYSPKKTAHLEMVSDKIVLSGECVSTSEDEYLNIPAGNDDQWVLVDESGNVVASYNKEYEKPYLFCNHEYKNYRANAHTSLDDGGCIVNMYEATRCSKCGDFNIGDWISSVTYAKCPHK
ncbi:MAG: M56 family metallopeptidase [Lachnospiraceae bacterium]|nr:M56 family metallopeptidase [Lachnospiraceae bacterium]